MESCGLARPDDLEDAASVCNIELCCYIISKTPPEEKEASIVRAIHRIIIYGARHNTFSQHEEMFDFLHKYVPGLRLSTDDLIDCDVSVSTGILARIVGCINETELLHNIPNIIKKIQDRPPYGMIIKLLAPYMAAAERHSIFAEIIINMQGFGSRSNFDFLAAADKYGNLTSDDWMNILSSMHKYYLGWAGDFIHFAMRRCRNPRS